uniref:Uncharacterized protein n=1 Tax=Trichobilharzia regenti TaxID=157069 RepID=A0AA85J4Y2_TRIRE|nr:unnamed protein product [Trichobilharzia regenti]
MNRRILFNKSFSYNFITKSNKFCCARFTCCHLLVLTANKCFYNSKAENFERRKYFCYLQHIRLRLLL